MRRNLFVLTFIGLSFSLSGQEFWQEKIVPTLPKRKIIPKSVSKPKTPLKLDKKIVKKTTPKKNMPKFTTKDFLLNLEELETEEFIQKLNKNARNWNYQEMRFIIWRTELIKKSEKAKWFDQ